MTEQERRSWEPHRDLLGPVPTEPVPVRDQLDRITFRILATTKPPIVPTDIDGDTTKGYDVFALARAYGARAIHPEIDSDLDVHHFLLRHSDQLDRLGFDPDRGVPSRSAFERLRSRLSRRILRELLDTYHVQRTTIVRKFDYEPYEPDYVVFPKSDEISTREVKQAYEQVRPVLEDAIPDARDQDKISFEWPDFHQILAESMINGESASQTIRNHRRPETPIENEMVPKHHSDPEVKEMRIRTFFNGIEANSFTTYMKRFEKVFERLIKRAQEHGFGDRPVNVHVDATDFIYTPQSYDENGQKKIADGAVGTKGGKYAYKFLTVSVEDRQSGRSLKPVVFPMRDRGLVHRAFCYVIRRVREYMTIHEVKADSEFATAGILNFLDSRNIDYRMRYAVKGGKIKNWLKRLTNQRTAGAMDYTINGASDSHDTRLLAKRAKYGSAHITGDQSGLQDFLVADDESQLDLDEFDGRSDPDEYDGPWFVYVTSHDVPDDDNSARKAAKKYAKRWQIETDYRVLKHRFMANTDSTEYAVRVLYWLYAVALFSAWKLADLAVRDVGDFRANGYSLRSRDFADAIVDVDYG